MAEAIECADVAQPGRFRPMRRSAYPSGSERLHEGGQVRAAARVAGADFAEHGGPDRLRPRRAFRHVDFVGAPHDQDPPGSSA